MSCFWKKSPLTPCSCAYQLHGSPDDIFSRLDQLGRRTTVIRQEGLSLSHAADSGPCDLETDPLRPREYYLLTDASDPRPQLASAEPGRAVDLSIRLDGHTWDSPAIRGMIRDFDGTSLGCAESRRLGAGAWLDDWTRIPSSDCHHVLVHAARRALADCRKLEVDVRTPAHRKVVRFEPSFIDSDGAVLRIADRNCRHVVFADAESPDFRLTSFSGSQVRISIALPTAC